jgi:hypothetical protein
LGLYDCNAYDELQLSQLEMQEIFDPVVIRNLELIAIQLSQTNGIKLMPIVGGFCGIPIFHVKDKTKI